jgi:RNA polymerase sigma factor (sigma-70 family)
MIRGDTLVTMTSMNDLDLLGEFIRDQSEDAFTALVQRHVGLVYCAALRQVRSPQLAEEVAQSVFTDLARTATRLKPDTIVTAWLYEVTRRTAINVVRGEARRQLREQIALEMTTMNATAQDWTQIEPLLDEAMHALEDTDRTAVLLRFFENKSLREVGETLGTTDDTARKRVNRAIEHLHEFFAKRGVTVGASGLVVVISANAVQAAPIGLAVSISTAAVLAAGTTITTAIATKALAMTTLQKTLIAAALVGSGFVIPLVVQQRQNNRLRAELVTLREQVSNNTNASAPLVQISATDEADRARRQSEHRELLRLRGQIALLRSELRKYAERDGTENRAVAMKAATDVAAENTPLVSAAFVARVPTGQTLISGGWINEPGKRIFMLSTPASTPNAENEGSIDIAAQVIEVSEATWKQLGWEQLRSDPQREMQGLLDASQTAQLLKTLDEIGEVTVRSNPRIRTANGQEAQIMIGEVPNDLRIGMLPTQTADKGAIDLSLSLHMSRSSTNSPAQEN